MVTSKDYQQDIERDIGIILLNDEREANQILDDILTDKGCAIGVDIEAAVEMSRFGILCLLQLAYKSNAYIFDMIAMNYKELRLKELFADKDIIKIFHDCLEDLSLLYNLYNIREFNNIFDTQIAHRLCYEDIYMSSVDTKHSSISLADLVKEYLQIESEAKSEMHVLMSKDPYLWKKRPISPKMLEYAANDVAHLPKIFYFIKENCIKGVYKNLTFNTIFEECNKYLYYSKINLAIKNFNKIHIQKDREIQGLLKSEFIFISYRNIKNNCVFIQLNIGYNGVITNKKSIQFLQMNHKLGDILNFKIVKLDAEKKRYLLDLSLSKETYSNEYYCLREAKDEQLFQTQEEAEQGSHVIISAEDDDKVNCASQKRSCLNVNENSFFPQSFLKGPRNGLTPNKSHPVSSFKKDDCANSIPVQVNTQAHAQTQVIDPDLLFKSNTFPFFLENPNAQEGK